MALHTGIGRRASIALLIAVFLSLGFLAAGFTVPVYEGVTSGPGPTVTETSKTLVAENGSGVVPLIAFPLLASLIVAIALLGRGRSAAMAVAWTATGAVALLNLLAILTIGIFLVPVTIALVVACTAATAERRASRSLSIEPR